MKYQRHSGTSRAAAASAEPKAATRRAQVYRFIVLQGLTGATDEEISLALRMGGSTQRPRRVELMDGGHVVDSGRRRFTASGRQAVVWVAKRVLPTPSGQGVPRSPLDSLSDEACIVSAASSGGA